MITSTDQPAPEKVVDKEFLIVNGMDAKLADHYLKYVAPNIPLVEESRKKIFIDDNNEQLTAMFWGMMCGPVLAILIMLLGHSLFMFYLAFGLGALVYSNLIKQFKQKRIDKYYQNLYEHLVSSMLKYVGDHYVISDDALVKDFIDKSMLLSLETRHVFDGKPSAISKSICFDYHGVPIKITEAKRRFMESEDSTQEYEHNIIINADIPKKFKGMTIVVRANKFGMWDKVYQSLSSVSLESPELEEAYAVYSTDQVEARYLCTTSFIDRFTQLGQFTNSDVFAYFYEGKLFLQLLLRNEMESPLLRKSDLAYPQDYVEMTKNLVMQMTSILKILDKIDVEDKTGL